MGSPWLCGRNFVSDYGYVVGRFVVGMGSAGSRHARTIMWREIAHVAKSEERP